MRMNLFLFSCFADGGGQERDKAMALIKEQFPDAEIEAKSNSSNRVVIEVQKPFHAEVANVAQRDLYRKYQWPAAPGMTEKLQMLKEEINS